jgi:hypothetical protein
MKLDVSIKILTHVYDGDFLNENMDTIMKKKEIILKCNKKKR